MSPHKRATGKKNRPRSRNMFICANPMYSCKISGPKAYPFFLGKFFLILVHLSYPGHRKNHVEGKKLKPLSNVTSQGVVPWRPTLWDIWHSLKATHTKKEVKSKSASWSSFNSQSTIYLSISCFFCSIHPKKNVISCRAFPHGDHGVVSGVLFH